MSTRNFFLAILILLLQLGLGSSCRKDTGSPEPPPSTSGRWPELPREEGLRIEVGDSGEDVSTVRMGFLATVQADGISREAAGSSIILTLVNSSSESSPVIVLTAYQRVRLDPIEGDLDLQSDGALGGEIAPMGTALLRLTAVAVGEPEEPGELIEIRSPSGVDRIEAWIAPLLGEWRSAGRDGKELDLGMVAVHAALVRNGDSAQVLFFSPPRQKRKDGSFRRRRKGDTTGGGYYWRISQVNAVEIALWDLESGEVEKRPMDRPQNLFCSGHAHLPDGKLLVVGGHIGFFTHNADRLHLFDASVQNHWWTRLDDKLPETRWYPTVTPLPDGKMLITSGRGAPLLGGPLDILLGWYRTARRTYEIFDPASNTLVPIPISEKMFVDDDKLATYPSVIVLPGGENHPDGLLFAQERTNAWLFSYDSQSGGRLSPEAGPYKMKSKGSRSYPYYGSSALLPFEAEGATSFRILIVGGQREDNENHRDYSEKQTPTRIAEIFELDNTRRPSRQNGWKRIEPLGQARLLPGTAHLADGKVLVTGGTRRGWANCNDGDILISELFDPESDHFYQMAPARVGRRYHSTTMLLPDGTLLSAGSTGGYNINNKCIDPEFVAERFYPPYLWHGPRPRITVSTPTDVHYDGEWGITVESSELEGMRAALVRLASVTHGNNMDQRYLWLKEGSRRSVPGGAQLSILAPSSGTVAPPGDYMLILLDGAGVPSQARLVRLLI